MNFKNWTYKVYISAFHFTKFIIFPGLPNSGPKSWLRLRCWKVFHYSLQNYSSHYIAIKMINLYMTDF